MEEILMGTHGNIEREINLIELFWGILFNWRQILCVGIIFAVLLSGVKYVGDTKDYRKAQNAGSELEEIELTNEEEEEVDSAKKIMERIEEYENYMDNSVYMQLNPYKKHIVELQYFVKSDYIINYTQDHYHDYTEAIMAMYNDYITGHAYSRTHQ